MLPVPMSVLLYFTVQTFITFNALILELTMPFFPVILHYIQFFMLKIIISSVFTFTSSRQTFSELKFSFLPVIMLSVSLLISSFSNFFNYKFLQLQISSTSNFSNFKSLQLQISPTSNFFHFEILPLQISSTSNFFNFKFL